MRNDSRLEVRLPRGLLVRLPRGRERSEFVRRALETELRRGVPLPAGDGVTDDRLAVQVHGISPQTPVPRGAAVKPSVAELLRAAGGQLSSSGAERALGDGSWKRWMP